VKGAEYGWCVESGCARGVQLVVGTLSLGGGDGGQVVVGRDV